MKKTIKDTNFYALICDDSKYAGKLPDGVMLCGVFASKEEAEEVADTIKDCLCKHYIKRCDVTVTF